MEGIRSRSKFKYVKRIDNWVTTNPPGKMSEGDFDMRKECYENLADLCGVPGYLLEFQVRPFFQRQIDFIQESGIVTAMVGLLNAPPGTRLHERMREEGRLIDAMSGDNVDGTTNFMPRMGLDVLRKGHRNLMRHIYTPEHYYKRAMTFLREYQKPRVGIPMDFQCLLAVFTIDYPPWNFRRGTIPVLENPVLDAFLPSSIFDTDHKSGDLRSSFSKNQQQEDNTMIEASTEVVFQ